MPSPVRTFTTASLQKTTVEDLKAIRDAHDDDNLDTTVRRLIDSYRE